MIALAKGMLFFNSSTSFAWVLTVFDILDKRLFSSLSQYHYKNGKAFKEDVDIYFVFLNTKSFILHTSVMAVIDTVS